MVKRQSTLSHEERVAVIERHGAKLDNACEQCRQRKRPCIVRLDMDCGRGKFKCASCLMSRNACSLSDMAEYTTIARIDATSGPLTTLDKIAAKAAAAEPGNQPRVEIVPPRDVAGRQDTATTQAANDTPKGAGQSGVVLEDERMSKRPRTAGWQSSGGDSSSNSGPTREFVLAEFRSLEQSILDARDHIIQAMKLMMDTLVEQHCHIFDQFGILGEQRPSSHPLMQRMGSLGHSSSASLSERTRATGAGSHRNHKSRRTGSMADGLDPFLVRRALSTDEE